MSEAEVASIITEIVAKAGRIKGAELARALRLRVPDWRPADHGVANLREFIGKSVKGIHVSGRSGMDLWYETLAEQGSTRELERVDLWRVWVSPKSPYLLAVRQQDGEVVALSRSSLPPAGALSFEPPAVEFHQQIARDFLLNRGLRSDALSEVIDVGGAQWWQRWYSALKREGLASSWNEFRRERLQGELKKALAALGLSEDAAAKAYRSICAEPDMAETDSSKRTELRRTVLLAIERMSEEELRELRLPVGLVIDVMRSRNA